MHDEEWRQVEGWPYDISNRGRIMSQRTGHITHGWLGNTGYYHYTLSNRGRLRQGQVHRLMAITFLGEPPSPKHYASHNDGARTNNTISNIRWATPQGNQLDRGFHGTCNGGERNHYAKLTWDKAEAIRNAYSQMKARYPYKLPNGLLKAFLAECGIKKPALYALISGHTWRPETIR